MSSVLFKSCVGALTVLVAGAACGQSVADSIESARRLSLSPALQGLAPSQPYAVQADDVEPPQVLPEPLSYMGEGPIDPAGTGNSQIPAPDAISQVDISYIRGWSPLRPMAGKPGISAGGRSQLSLMSPGNTDAWTLGADNWRYSRADGTKLVLGNDWSSASVVGDRVRLGGVGLTQSLTEKAEGEGSWQYSVMLGALDYSGEAGKQGGLTYGPTAGESVLRYGVSRQLSVETQMQWAPDMVVSGIGGKYATKGLGAWQAGVAKATRNFNQGWRYRVGYEVNVISSLNLSWTHEQRTGGYSDLANYRDFTLDSGRNRNLWSAKLSMGRWGVLNGTFEQLSSPGGAIKQQFGVSQQFWYSPNLRISLRTERELISGDYAFGLGLAVPLY